MPPCRDDGIVGVLQYSTDLFDTQTMDRMAQHLSNLLAAVTARPEAPLSSLGYMSAEEQQLVLHTFNDTAGQVPSTCVHTFFERQVAATPHVSCLIDSATGSSLTYAEVNSAANRLAQHLSSVGIAADVPVAVLMDKCFEAYIALIAILKAGGEDRAPAANAQPQKVSVCTAMVLSSHTRPHLHLFLLSESHVSLLCAGCYQPIDHTLPAARVAEVLQQSGARVLLVSPALADIQDSLPSVEALVAEPAWRQFSDLSPSNLPSRSSVDSAAYLMFSSGARDDAPLIQLLSVPGFP